MIEKALEEYEFYNPKAEFIRHNENITYKISDDKVIYLLRIHQPVKGFSLDLYQKDGSASDYILGEMKLLDFMKCSKTRLQVPVKNKKGNLVSFVDNTPITVLKWIEGNIVQNIDESKAYQIGQLIAGLHQDFVESKIHEQEFKRYMYDEACLLDIIDELNLAKKLGHINELSRDLLISVCYEIITCMTNLDKRVDYGYIHSDLSKDNLIESQQNMIPIDFSLSGYGYYTMDVAFILCQIKDNTTKKTLVDAYENKMAVKLSIRDLEVFYAFGVLLYIACQHEKIHKLDWFVEKLEKWSETIFYPLVNNERFLYREE